MRLLPSTDPSLSSTPANRTSATTTTTTTPSSNSSMSSADVQNMHEEVRQLRQQVDQAASVADVLHLLDRFLELTGTMVERFISGSSSDGDFRSSRSSYTYILDAMLSGVKTAITRWEQVKGAGRDTSLSSVRYVFGTLPVYIDWTSAKHMEDLENVLLTCTTLVKFWPVIPPPNAAAAPRNRRESHRRSR